MMRHACDYGVLVITLYSDAGPADRTGLFTRLGSLVRMHDPRPVVLVLAGPDIAEDALDVVLRVHRLCTRLGLLLSVACPSAPVRRLLEANADPDGAPPVIHARADTAVATAGALVRTAAVLA